MIVTDSPPRRVSQDLRDAQTRLGRAVVRGEDELDLDRLRTLRDALLPAQNKNARAGCARPKLMSAATLALVLVVGTVDAEGWSRPRWARRDGVDTRARVLEARCREVTWVGHHVAHAVCKDFYTGLEVATDDAPHALQIDHLLPAVRAWRGKVWMDGALWRQGKYLCSDPRSCAEFKSFYNDEDNLQVTRARTNERKGDLLPDRWCPASRGARIVVATRYRRVAARYGLTLTHGEEVGLKAWAAGMCAPGARVLGAD